jgi:hypothetical protein
MAGPDPAIHACGVKSEARPSFFEKKEVKKLLLLRALAPALPLPPISKSFLVLFFKKEPLPSLS